MTELFGLLVVSFILRILPRFIRPYAVSTDTYYHFAAAESIRLNSFRIPNKINGYLMDSPYDYPPLFHYLLALFNKETREKLEKYISATLDTFHVALVYVFSLYFFKYIYTVEQPGTYSLMISVLFLLSPALLSVGTGPRAYQATPRVLGELLSEVSFIVLFLYWWYGYFFLYVIAVVITAMVMMTSKFSTQVMVFFSVVMCVLLKSILFLLFPVFAILVATLLSGGYYAKVLKGHIGHLRIFRNVTIKKYQTILYKNNLKDILTLPRDVVFSYKKALKTIFFNNTYIIVLSRNPQIILVVLIIVWLQPIFLITEVRYYLFAWMTASIVCFLATSMRPLMFIGEGDRYLEYGLFPQVFIFTCFMLPSKHSITILTALIVYQVLYYTVSVIMFVRMHVDDPLSATYKEELFEFLRKHGSSLRILPVGMIYELTYRGQCNIFFPSGNFAVNYISEEEYKELYEIYGIPNRNLIGLMNKYNLNAIFVSKKTVADVENRYGIFYDFSNFKTLYENAQYIVYAIGNSTVTELSCT
ncbi:MAG: hypothetical protein HQL06_08985 [Nitrospirae bacterium]|nr:hypothetical protein [Nitrospirota bacterium]